MVKITETISTTERVPNLDAIYGPYQSITAAEEALRDAERNVLGATVGIIEDGKIKEYWYKENTNELVLKGGEGGEVDPEIEERVEDLEQNKVDKVNEVHKIIPQTPVHTYDNYGVKYSDGHIDIASGYKVLEYKVEAGKTYFVSGQTGDGSSLCLGAFLNNITEGTGTTGTLVGSALFPQSEEENRHRDFSRETIIAPSGATHIRIQQINSYGHNADLELYESETINVVDDISDLNKGFDRLSAKVGDIDEVLGKKEGTQNLFVYDTMGANLGLGYTTGAFYVDRAEPRRYFGVAVPVAPNTLCTVDATGVVGANRTHILGCAQYPAAGVFPTAELARVNNIGAKVSFTTGESDSYLFIILAVINADSVNDSALKVYYGTEWEEESDYYDIPDLLKDVNSLVGTLPFNGKKFYSFGDSICYQLMWQLELAKLTGMIHQTDAVRDTEHPLGVGGSSISPRIMVSTSNLGDAYKCLDNNGNQLTKGGQPIWFIVGRKPGQSIYTRASYFANYNDAEVIVLNVGANDQIGNAYTSSTPTAGTASDIAYEGLEYVLTEDAQIAKYYPNVAIYDDGTLDRTEYPASQYTIITECPSLISCVYGMMKKILTACPTAKVVANTPHKPQVFINGVYRAIPQHAVDKQTALVAAYSQLAIPIADMWSDFGANEYNVLISGSAAMDSYFYKNDSSGSTKTYVHPNERGGRRMAEIIAAKMQ